MALLGHVTNIYLNNRILWLEGINWGWVGLLTTGGGWAYVQLACGLMSHVGERRGGANRASVAGRTWETSHRPPQYYKVVYE